jgi:ribosome-associated toxin RatA of RatAB toxin-antitoxin module
MPRIQSETVVDIDIETAFALSQTYGEIRYMWDPFVKEQHLLNGATKAAKGVQTKTKSKHGLEMISEYITYKPPTHVGMKMIKGPKIFSSFSGGWNFTELPDGKTKATWRDNFVSRPKFLSKIMDAIGTKLLQKDIDQRLNAFKHACSNQEIIDKLK